MSLRAIPQGLTTWNFHLLDGEEVVAATHYTIIGESGEITVGEKRLTIERQGPVSGEWRLTGDGSQELAVARKPNPLTRRIEMEWGDAGTLSMEGAHPMTRRMVISAQGNPIGEIVPDHLFTRKATLDFPDGASLEVRCFCLWLAVLMWRRAAQNSSSSGGD